jgi:hypothetical protein
MSLLGGPRRLATATVAAIALAGCGAVEVQPSAGRGRIDSQATMNPDHLTCLRKAHLAVTVVNRQVLQIGPLPTGPTVVFTPTPSSAQDAQIYGQAQGAEAIGSALLWVHQGSDGELKKIEDCLAIGVKE